MNIETILIAVIASVPGILAYVAVRGKNSADAAGSLVKTSLELRDEMREDKAELQKQVDLLRAELEMERAARHRSDKMLDDVRAEIDSKNTTMLSMQVEINQLRRENQALKEQIAQLEQNNRHE